MAVFGFAMAVTLTPMSALGVLQAPEDEPGSLPGISNAPTVSAAHSDSPGQERLSEPGPWRVTTRPYGSASASASLRSSRAWF